MATKFGKLAVEGDVNALGLSRHAMMTCVDRSLQNLGTDYIDLYYVSTEVGGAVQSLH